MKHLRSCVPKDTALPCLLNVPAHGPQDAPPSSLLAFDCPVLTDLQDDRFDSCIVSYVLELLKNFNFHRNLIHSSEQKILL